MCGVPIIVNSHPASIEAAISISRHSISNQNFDWLNPDKFFRISIDSTMQASVMFLAILIFISTEASVDGQFARSSEPTSLFVKVE